MSALAGFPTRLEGPMTWTGSKFETKPESYVIFFSRAEVQDLNQAISHFKSKLNSFSPSAKVIITEREPELGLSRGNISPQTFPLPQLISGKLRNINEEVNNGRGFVVLRGITVSDYSEEDVIVLYAGLTSHVASHRAGFIGKAEHKASKRSYTKLHPF
jgi:hypothetical protein